MASAHANAGFKMLDLSLFHMTNPSSPFNAENWKETAQDLRAYADELGVTFNQAHLPFNFKWNAPNEWERFIGSAHDRALEVCGIMGVKYVVAHPIHHMEYLGHEEEVYEYNMRYYRTMIPYCKKYGYKGTEFAEYLLYNNIVCEFCDEDYTFHYFLLHCKLTHLYKDTNTCVCIKLSYQSKVFAFAFFVYQATQG